MNSNVIGTLFRIVMIAGSLLLFWFCVVCFIYIIVTVIFNMEFSLLTALYLYGLFMFIKMFYPENIFKYE